MDAGFSTVSKRQNMHFAILAISTNDFQQRISFLFKLVDERQHIFMNPAFHRLLMIFTAGSICTILHTLMASDQPAILLPDLRVRFAIDQIHVLNLQTR